MPASPHPLPPDLAAVRGSVHRVAEHVLSPARYAAVRRIGLQPLSDGVTTPEFGPAPTVVALRGDRLVVTAAGATREAPATTLRAAGGFVGVVPGAPAEVYRPATPCLLDEPLSLTPATVAYLGWWWTTGAAALAGLDAPPPTLWPEHLDLATTVDGVNLGISPGDAEIDLPYVYVGPHGGPPVRDAFWNASFGAARTVEQLADPEGIADFFRDGLDRARLATSTTGSRGSS